METFDFYGFMDFLWCAQISYRMLRLKNTSHEAPVNCPGSGVVFRSHRVPGVPGNSTDGRENHIHQVPSAFFAALLDGLPDWQTDHIYIYIIVIVGFTQL